MIKYGPIRNASDLKLLQDECGDKCKAVGFTSEGNMYIIDNFSAKAITKDEAKDILGVSDAEIELLVLSRGKHIIDKKEEVLVDDELQTVNLDKEVNDLPEATNPEQFEEVQEKNDDVELQEIKETPAIVTVEITKEEYDRLLEIQEHSEYLEDEVNRLTYQRDAAKEELDLIKNSIKVIKNI